jgi:ADP-L-glycero-D-manno-heptose 6-epimerase
MILITGGAGFIGSNVVAALNAAGISDVIIADDLTDGRKCLNLVGKQFYDYIDYRDTPRYLKTRKSVDIIHLGANSNTADWNGRAMIANNYTFSKKLMRYALRHNRKFVYASSASVYGAGARGFVEKPEAERPRSPYAVSKCLLDRWARRQIVKAPADAAHVIGLRYFNVYGPGEAHKDDMASFAFKCFLAIAENKPIKLFENSDNIYRDFIYVRDAAAITVKFFMETTAQNSGIYNVGTGDSVSFFTVQTLIAGAAAQDGRRVQLENCAMPKILQRSYQNYTKADTAKLIQVFPEISPQWFTPIENGIADYYKEFFTAHV